jgi:hypothetical protein
MICPHCHQPIPEDAIRSEAARLNSALRANPGRKPTMRKCPRCGQSHSARDMRRCRK